VNSLLAAELIKLRTTRTAAALLAATVAVSALAVASAVVVGADSSTFDLATDDGVRRILNVSANGSIFVLVLGVIISAGEFRHGTATDTFITTPRRERVITAKLAAATFTGVAFGAVASSVAIAVAGLTYRAKGITFPLRSSGAWSTLGGAVLYAALFGAIGAASGSLIRNQVAGIVGWLAWLAIVEHIAVGFFSAIGRWLPAAAGQALVRAPNEDLLSQSTAALVLLFYAAAIGATAIISERYRDG
jgi:ABC-2 type transport system permease protein